MIILDPDMDGCNIYNGRYRQRVKGTIKEITDLIIGYVTRNGMLDTQYEDVILDCMGIGMAYSDIFKSKNIRFIKMENKNIVGKF